MLQSVTYSDTVILSKSVVSLQNTDVTNPLEPTLLDTARTLSKGVFVVGGVSYTLPNRANRSGWLTGKNRLGSVWNFTTKDMAAKAVSGHGRFDTQPSHTSIRCSAENGRAKVARTMSLKWPPCLAIMPKVYLVLL